MIRLSECNQNKNYVIQENNSFGTLKERLNSLGFIKGALILKISSTKKSMDIYLIKGMMIALRKKEAEYIWIN